MSVAKRLKAEGLRKGVPDVALDHARGGWYGLRIEMKRLKNSTVSPEQKAWGQQLMAEGYAWRVCRGWEEARDVILEYLAQRKTEVA
jgi:hypothetical protein